MSSSDTGDIDGTTELQPVPESRTDRQAASGSLSAGKPTSDREDSLNGRPQQRRFDEGGIFDTLCRCCPGAPYSHECHKLTLVALLVLALAAVIGLAIGVALKSSGDNVTIVNNTPSSTASASAIPAAPSGYGKSIDAVDYYEFDFHLRALNATNNAYGGNRLPLSAAYNATLAYILHVISTNNAAYFSSSSYITRSGQTASQKAQAINWASFFTTEIRACPYTVTSNAFVQISLAHINASAPVAAQFSALQGGVDYMTVDNGGLTAPSVVAPVAWIVGDPCSSLSFPVATVGAVAVTNISENCPTLAQVQNAAAAGAVAVIYINTIEMPLVLDAAVALPVLSVVNGDFAVLLQSIVAQYVMVELNVTVSGAVSVQSTSTLLVSTKTGAPTTTMLVGGHVDSVAGSPGVNDNLSGIAGMLSMMSAMLRAGGLSNYQNRLSFVLFSHGSAAYDHWGSRCFLNTASTSSVVGNRLSDFAAYFSFDSIGAANGINGVMDWENSPVVGASGTQSSSFFLSLWLWRYFNAAQVPTTTYTFDTIFDAAIFQANNIPTSGVTAGTTAIMTEDQASTYTIALADVPYSPCDGLPCDSLRTVNEVLALNLTRAMTFAADYLAQRSDLTALLYGARGGSLGSNGYF